MLGVLVCRVFWDCKSWKALVVEVGWINATPIDFAFAQLGYYTHKLFQFLLLTPLSPSLCSPS
jgi:hypothetical protein